MMLSNAMLMIWQNQHVFLMGSMFISSWIVFSVRLIIITISLDGMTSPPLFLISMRWNERALFLNIYEINECTL